MAVASKVGKLFLNKEVSLRDLNQGIEFEVDCDEQYSDSENESYFEEEEFKSFKEDVVSMDKDHKPKLLHNADIAFAQLKERMTQVTDDGKVLKEVIKSGFGILIPDKSVVMMHYDAYLEKQAEPFDSTRLRKKPYKFLFGNGSLLPGLELGIRTMKKEEISRFVVSPDYAYGAMGCPPRIPPSSEIMYEVEILNFYDSKQAIEFEDMDPAEQKAAPFEKVIEIYHCELKLASDLFHNKSYKPAIARYRRAVKILEDVSAANEEEDEKRKSYLLKLYLNLAQCYINTENPERAIIYADLALKFNPEHPKALYRMGYALHMVSDYERAEHFLNKAKKYAPFNKSIIAAIEKLEFKRKQHQDWEKMFCTNMFISKSNKQEEKTRELPESPEFISAIEEQFVEFIETDENEYTFSSGYTENQIEVVKEMAKKYDLAFVSKIMGDTKINKIVKRS